MRWIWLGVLGAAATVGAVIFRRRRRATEYRVGHISEQWIVRHRAFSDDPWQ